MVKLIYLDNAATTKPYPEVVDAMLPYFKEEYGNASSLYSLGQTSEDAIENARQIIANSIGAKPEEIYFTSGGSESDNWAIKGVMANYGECGYHIITSSIEHPAVLNTCKFLQNHGTAVTYVGVNENGEVSPALISYYAHPKTVLVSIMYANNEIGTIQDVESIARICKNKGIIFHVDAVQAYGQVPINVHKTGIDLLSASAHKVHGPKGVGFLYVKDGLSIENLIHGGHQEEGRRAGTENVAGIVGFGKAVEITMRDFDKNKRHMRELSDYLIRRVLNEIPKTRLNGPRQNRLPNNASFTFEGVEGESLLILLDMQGICVSSGSACTSGQQEASHVLRAIGQPEELAHGALRITLSYDTSREDIDRLVEMLIRYVGDLRRK